MNVRKILTMAVRANSLFETDPAAGAGAGTGTGAAGAGTGAGTGAGATPPGEKTFTQAEVNTLMAGERRTLQEKLQKLNTDHTLTAQAKQALEQQIAELRSSTMTEKEKMTEALEQERKDSQARIKASEESAKTWQDRYTRSSIDSALTGAAAANEAFNVSQILKILGPDTRLVEKIGEDGKGTGEFEVKSKISYSKPSGERVEVDLNPDEAVKKLKDMPEYANLFKGTKIAGLGGSNGSGTRSGEVNLKDTNTYMEARKKSKASVGL